jgi:putative ABC transport system permease protein
MLELKNVSKFYYSKGIIATGFSKVSLKFEPGEFVAITGESGSGKSTLLNVISGLDSYEEGEMYINGEETSHYTEKDYEIYRRKYIGNIFQNFNLVNSYTVYQNIELIMLINGKTRKEVKDKVIELIKEVDLYKYRNTKVSKLSGGQKQRVAIARALAQETPIILADEPTGNLDKKSSESVLKLLHDISKNKLVIVVTHNYDQIEKYTTRKIVMHDGRVMEDKKIRDYIKVEKPKISNNKDIRSLSKLRLGLRNTFNIIPKFLLILFVYIFIIYAMFFAYSSFKYAAYEESLNGYNPFFSNKDENRIVIKKKNGEEFTEEDYKKIEKIDNVDSIMKNDLALDNEIYIESSTTSLYGNILSIKSLEKVDVGRFPESDNEIIVSVTKDYYLADEIMPLEYELSSMNGFKDEDTIKVVGVVYNDKNATYFYVNDSILEKLNAAANYQYSTVKYVFAGEENTSFLGSIYGEIIPSKKVAKGKIVISSENLYKCKDMQCKNYSFKINIDNPFYNDTYEFKVGNTYTKKNFNKLTGYDFDKYNGAIFMNYDEYKDMFNKKYYQSSIFMKNSKKSKETIKELEALDLTVLYIKDTLSDGSEALRIYNIIKVIGMSIMIIVLFFISYFVIRLVLKSRNIYYSTLRILGSSYRTTKSLLNIELLATSHIAYVIFLIFLLLVKYSIIENAYIRKLLGFVNIYQFIFLYLVIFLISRMITNRYSRKLFTNTVMNTYKEEV